MMNRCFPRCGVRSERFDFASLVIGVAPRSGMPRPVGAEWLSQRDIVFWVFGYPRVSPPRVEGPPHTAKWRTCDRSSSMRGCTPIWCAAPRLGGIAANH